jgi:hypothetical protein
MKRNLTIGVGVAILVSLIAFFVLSQNPKDEQHWIGKAHETLGGVFRFETTNTWRDVKASGGVTFRFMERKKVEYFLTQTSDQRALDEIQNEFGSRKEGKDIGSFSYFPNYDPSHWKLQGKALDLAPWWNEAMGSSCTLIRFGTNLSGTAVSARVFVFSRDSNTVLYAHIIENR